MNTPRRPERNVGPLPAASPFVAPKSPGECSRAYGSGQAMAAAHQGSNRHQPATRTVHPSGASSSDGSGATSVSVMTTFLSSWAGRAIYTVPAAVPSRTQRGLRSVGAGSAAFTGKGQLGTAGEASKVTGVVRLVRTSSIATLWAGELTSSVRQSRIAERPRLGLSRRRASSISPRLLFRCTRSSSRRQHVGRPLSQRDRSARVFPAC